MLSDQIKGNIDVLLVSETKIDDVLLVSEQQAIRIDVLLVSETKIDELEVF